MHCSKPLLTDHSDKSPNAAVKQEPGVKREPVIKHEHAVKREPVIKQEPVDEQTMDQLPRVSPSIRPHPTTLAVFTVPARTTSEIKYEPIEDRKPIKREHSPSPVVATHAQPIKRDPERERRRERSPARRQSPPSREYRDRSPLRPPYPKERWDAQRRVSTLTTVH